MEEKDQNSIALYDTIIRFLGNITDNYEIKDEILDTNIIEKLREHKKQLKDVLNSYGKNNKILEIINVNIIVILANLMNDKQIEKFEFEFTTIKTILDIINETIKQSKTNDVKRNTKFYFSYDFSNTRINGYVFRYLKCLKQLTVNDSIKDKLAQINWLQIIKHIFIYSEDIEEQQLCADLILSLCFNSKIKEQVKIDELFDVIERKASRKNNINLSSTCTQIVDVLNGKLDERQSKNNTKPMPINAKHIMISYSRENKEICMELNKILISKGYKTWIDVGDSKSENLLDMMADAVENASIVLLCYSNSYKMSSNCRLEAEYARKLGKNLIPIKVESKYNPDGWLGILLGEKKYIDFSSAEKIADKSKITELFERIDNMNK